MCALLVFAGSSVIIEGLELYKSGDFSFYLGLAIAIFSWIAWSLIFFLSSRTADPNSLITQQCKLLLRGSILELLIAVPTHILARSRNECCAGIFTFFGLAAGIAVMLFSFGPAVFFLYLERWRQLRPNGKREVGLKLTR